jgi:hypothetical protein
VALLVDFIFAMGLLVGCCVGVFYELFLKKSLVKIGFLQAVQENACKKPSFTSNCLRGSYD